MSTELEKAVISNVLEDARLRYSPRLEAILRLLSQHYFEGIPNDFERHRHGLPAKEIAYQVFKGSGRDIFDDEPRVRQSIARLREHLHRYFEDDPEGSKSPYTVRIDHGNGRGYRLIFVPRAQPRSALRVFLCHSSGDKERVRQLHERLARDGFAPWLDEEDLLPGQNWEAEIIKAVRSSEVVLVCLSASSVTKQGFVQKEIKIALDVADEKPDGTVYIIPLRLEDCGVPERLRKWQWVNFFEPKGYDRLLNSLRLRAAN